MHAALLGITLASIHHATACIWSLQGRGLAFAVGIFFVLPFHENDQKGRSNDDEQIHNHEAGIHVYL